MQIKNIYQFLPTNIKDQMPAQQTSTTNSSLCLYHNTTTCDQHCQMPQIETLNLTKFMVCFSHHLTTDVQRWHGNKTDIEFQSHSEMLGYFPLEIVLMVSEATKILSIISHCFSEFLRMIDLLISKATLNANIRMIDLLISKATLNANILASSHDLTVTDHSFNFICCLMCKIVE